MLYDLIRDHIKIGTAQKLLCDYNTNKTEYTNGYLYNYCKYLYNELVSIKPCRYMWFSKFENNVYYYKLNYELGYDLDITLLFKDNMFIHTFMGKQIYIHQFNINDNFQECLKQNKQIFIGWLKKQNIIRDCDLIEQ